MHPVLLNFGDIRIYTYGFMLALAFLVGMTLAKREALRVGENPQKIMDLSFTILIAALVGSRLFYVATNPEQFLSNPLEIFKIWNGGLVFYGGFIAALVTAVVYMKIVRLPVWKTADIMAPSLAIGHFLGRLGCFFAGCCYGKDCELPWAVTFTHPESLAPTGTPLHPAQLYAAANNLLIFCLLWVLRRRKRFEGQVFWIYALLYGVTRALIEWYRGDFRGGVVLEIFSVSQMIGGAMALTAVIMIVFLGRCAQGAAQKYDRN